MADLLDSNDFDSIRRAISRSFDEDTVPNTDIEDPSILESAEEWIARETAGRELTEEQTRHARKATINYAAHLLAPSLQSQLAAAHVIHAGSGVGGVPNAFKIAQECLRRAESELALTVDPPDAVKSRVESTSTVGVSIRF